MATKQDAAIRERAYHLWVEGGRREDTSEQDWLRAEREQRSEPAGPAAAGETASPPEAKRSRKSGGPANAPARTAPASKPARPAPSTRKASAGSAAVETGR